MTIRNDDTLTGKFSVQEKVFIQFFSKVIKIVYKD